MATPLRAGARVRLDVQGQQQVGSGLVDPAGAFLIVGGLVRAVGGVGIHAGGEQPTLQPPGDVRDNVPLAQVPDDVAEIVVAVSRVDRDGHAGKGRAALAQPLCLPQHVRPPAHDGALQAAQLP